MSFANFIWENSNEIHQVEGQLEMAKDRNCYWKFFIFENFSTWASCPWELGHKKNLCIFPPPFIFHSWGSAFPNHTSFWVRLRALNSFLYERAFEPSAIKGSAFPILPPFECHFFSSAPSSPRPSKVVHFLSYFLLSAPSSSHLISFRAHLRALDHQR